MKNYSEKVVVITGCDSGIGRDLAEVCADKGYLVAASFLSSDPFRDSERIITRKCDLKKESDIVRFSAFVETLLRKKRKLYALVNNAGIASGGPIADLQLSLFREVMEVNFFGLVSLTSKLLPFIVQAKSRIIIHGSMAGKIALPFLAPYAASKFALEGYADSLRRELKPFGVSTVLLETAGVATPIWKKAKAMRLTDFSPVYRKSLKLFIERFVNEGLHGLSSKVAARRILKIMEKNNPRAREIISSSKIISRIESVVSDRVFDYAIGKLFGMNYGGPK